LMAKASVSGNLRVFLARCHVRMGLKQQKRPEYLHGSCIKKTKTHENGFAIRAFF